MKRMVGQVAVLEISSRDTFNWEKRNEQEIEWLRYQAISFAIENNAREYKIINAEQREFEHKPTPSALPELTYVKKPAPKPEDPDQIPPKRE